MMKQGWHSLILLTLPLCTIGSLAFLNTVTAQQVTQQVTSDGTVSTTVITPDGKNFTINDGTTRGTNLFHSFKEFSVPTGGSANFNNADNIQNIISRVTGGNASNIDGAIRALGKANLFLLNPAGIIFGPNASLNIGGSFLGSTANSFLFDNGFEFSATDLQAPPLLTINIPIGLRYRDNPGVIKVNGPETGSGIPYEPKNGPREPFDSKVTGLQVKPGKTLALVGGNVSVEGGVLRSEGGRVEIGSFDSNQVVKIVPQEQGLSLGYEGTPSFRDIDFSKQSFVNVTGDGGGSIAIKGKNINFNSGSLLLSDTRGDINGGEISIVGDSIIFNRSSLLANTFSSGNGAQIKLDANNIKFQDESGVSIQTSNKGKPGDINIRANSLEIGGKSAFVSLTTKESTGNSGNININVNGLFKVNGAGINSDSKGTGDAGNIKINANSFQIETLGMSSKVENTGKAGEININVANSLTSKASNITTDTSGTGNAGKININANSFQLEQGSVFSQAQANSTGNAGEININVPGSLVLPQGAGISTTTLGKGDAGTINITAGSFVLKGSNVLSNSDQNSTGNAGKINITAGSFELEGGQGVSSQMGKNSTGEGGEIKINVTDSLTIYKTKDGIITNTSGRGNAGKINITAGSFRLEEAPVGSQAQENSTGKAGEIKINVTGTLELPFGGSITTSTSGTGEAGKIDITANSFVLEGSNVSSNSEENSTGNAGTINITANSFLTNSSSVFSKTEENATGNGGKIKITVADLFKLDATGVKTENLGNGNGGDIKIEANNFYLTNGSQVRASTSGKGNGGSVTVNATGNVSADGKYFDEKGDKSGFYSSVGSSGVGNAGGVNITARSLSLTNGGTISTSNFGSGNAGEITVTTAKDIRLDNQGSIDANTRGGKGDITLNSRDLILRNNSNITTNAKGAANGGNIEINNTGNLVVFEDSKITADAEKGYGGNIIITARGIFRYPDSITATSEAGPQFNGTVQFNTPDIDPTRGLFELTETVIDPAQQIAQNVCIKGFGSSFTITGRGGLPTDPKNILTNDNVRVDLVKPATNTTANSTTASVDRPSKNPPVKRIIPAQGWIFNEKGEVMLVGYDPTKTGPIRQPQTPVSGCAAVK